MLDQAGKPGAGLNCSAIFQGMLELNTDDDYVRPGKLRAGFQHGDGGQRVQLAQFKKDSFEADDELL